MLTEEQIRNLFSEIGLISHELTQFNIENEYLRYKSSSRGVSLGEYTLVDTADDGAISVKIRGSLNLYEGYEVPLTGGSSREVSWQVGDVITEVVMTREELTLQGEGLSIYASPSVYLGGGKSLFGSSRGDVLPLNVLALLVAFSNMNEYMIYSLIDLVSDSGKGKASYLYSREEYRSLFPGRDEEEFWYWRWCVGYPNAKYSFDLEKTNGWRLSLPS